MGRLEAWIKERQPWEEEKSDELHLTTNFEKRNPLKLILIYLAICSIPVLIILLTTKK